MKLAIALSILIQAAIGVAQAADNCPSLPPEAGMTWTYQQGPDFGVCYAVDAATHKDAFGLYLGFAPSFHPDPAKPFTEGVVGGHPVKWYRHAQGSDSAKLSQEALVNLDRGAIAHVWVVAASEQEMAQRLSVLSRLQFK